MSSSIDVRPASSNPCGVRIRSPDTLSVSVSLNVLFDSNPTADLFRSEGSSTKLPSPRCGIKVSALLPAAGRPRARFPGIPLHHRKTVAAGIGFSSAIFFSRYSKPCEGKNTRGYFQAMRLGRWKELPSGTGSRSAGFLQGAVGASDHQTIKSLGIVLIESLHNEAV